MRLAAGLWSNLLSVPTLKSAPQQFRVFTKSTAILDFQNRKFIMPRLTCKANMHYGWGDNIFFWRWQLSAIWNFQIQKNLTADWMCGSQMHHRVKLHQNPSNGCINMLIGWFFKILAVRHLGFSKTKFITPCLMQRAKMHWTGSRKFTQIPSIL